MESQIWTIRNVFIFLGVGAGVSLIYLGVEKFMGIVSTTV